MEPQLLKSINDRLDIRLNSFGKHNFDDLSNETTYSEHSLVVKHLGDLQLMEEGKKFVIDDNNKDIFRFLLYYFNECPLYKDIFPEGNYSIHKQILLCGVPGTGKTLIMKIFAEYLKLTKNPKLYINSSITKMINYYKINNHLDQFTYNETKTANFEGKPLSLCMNDVGLDTYKYYGTDFKMLVDEFLHARNEIFIDTKKPAHLTTNLSVKDIKLMFDERLVDRFKTYNIIPLKGQSRR